MFFRPGEKGWQWAPAIWIMICGPDLAIGNIEILRAVVKMERSAVGLLAGEHGT